MLIDLRARTGRETWVRNVIESFYLRTCQLPRSSMHASACTRRGPTCARSARIKSQSLGTINGWRYATNSAVTVDCGKCCERIFLHFETLDKLSMFSHEAHWSFRPRFHGRIVRILYVKALTFLFLRNVNVNYCGVDLFLLNML